MGVGARQCGAGRDPPGEGRRAGGVGGARAPMRERGRRTGFSSPSRPRATLRTPPARPRGSPAPTPHAGDAKTGQRGRRSSGRGRERTVARARTHDAGVRPKMVRPPRAGSQPAARPEPQRRRGACGPPAGDPATCRMSPSSSHLWQGRNPRDQPRGARGVRRTQAELQAGQVPHVGRELAAQGRRQRAGGPEQGAEGGCGARRGHMKRKEGRNEEREQRRPLPAFTCSF